MLLAASWAFYLELLVGLASREDSGWQRCVTCMGIPPLSFWMCGIVSNGTKSHYNAGWLVTYWFFRLKMGSDVRRGRLLYHPFPPRRRLQMTMGALAQICNRVSSTRGYVATVLPVTEDDMPSVSITIQTPFRILRYTKRYTSPLKKWLRNSVRPSR